MRFNRLKVAISLLALVASAASAAGDELQPASRLLDYAPASAESVLVVNSPFEIRPTKDLEVASIVDTAARFATFLAQQEAIPLASRRCKGGMTASKDIRLPDGKGRIANGPFRSVRCELLMLSEKNAKAMVLEAIDKRSGKLMNRGGHDVLTVMSGKESLLLVFLTEEIVCVANDEPFLLEVLATADKKRKSLRENSTFIIASSLVTDSSLVWGVRMFLEAAHKDDATSLRNADNLCGFHDPKVRIVGLEIPKGRETVRFHYVSANPNALATKLPPSVIAPVISSNSRQIKVGDSAHTSWTIESKVSGTGDSPPALIFNGYCVTLGQGLML